MWGCKTPPQAICVSRWGVPNVITSRRTLAAAQVEGALVALHARAAPGKFMRMFTGAAADIAAFPGDYVVLGQLAAACAVQSFGASGEYRACRDYRLSR